ncbi:NAD(P)/FAD-dependent oxidoreductase [Leptospira sarikeiensis]|uniref:NAD(P)/FAD-dependent oxidoreductase n=1 Tax=Leptospira sarikeiensis TaxID=2484943 RepID=A0A4R9K8N9_9LEPT|nr:NAD(P)/FAD-dependent oxidoreductase [Leptospira sarikeiensis]TGL61024.1 NAD(P)/FAD-dependent oxidoreductase [Leptospira sarikeiensis]
MSEDRFSRRVFLTALSISAALISLGSYFRFKKRKIEGSILGPDRETGHRLRQARSNFSPQGRIKTKVLIAGAGISGLSSGYYLSQFGIQDYLILDLENSVGGNSRYSETDSLKYPWGAHYLPQPGPESVLVRKFLDENGLVEGKDSKGNPIYPEKYLCFDPEERLFYQGRWQSGLVPRRSGEPDEQELLFRKIINSWQNKIGRDGLKAFCIPIDRSSRDPEILKLDKISFSDYLKASGIKSTEILWYADYCARDDYGGNSDNISAWAGIHYFCSRLREEEDSPPVLTWPEGNGFLLELLQKPSIEKIKTSTLVERIRLVSGKWEINAYDVKEKKDLLIEAEQVIYALPSFTRKYILGETDPFLQKLEYSPWLVANLFVDELPQGKGHPPAWENVIYKSKSLGYVVSTHQDLRALRPQSVLTYYMAFGEKDTLASRRSMLPKTWGNWKEEILADLKRPHPNIESLVSRVDIMTHAHAMIRPVPGFLWGGEREKLSKSESGLHFAHCDLSGISIFEEALYRGFEASKKVQASIKKI